MIGVGFALLFVAAYHLVSAAFWKRFQRRWENTPPSRATGGVLDYLRNIRNRSGRRVGMIMGGASEKDGLLNVRSIRCPRLSTIV